MEKTLKEIRPIEPADVPTEHNPSFRRELVSRAYCMLDFNVANWLVTWQVEDGLKIERYCDECLKANKHLDSGEYLTNFDVYFQKPPRPTHW